VHHIHALLRDAPCLGAEWREAEAFRRRPEEFLRMRLECQNAHRRAAGMGMRQAARDQRLMAAMDAVEIADRHNRAFAIGGHVIVVAEDAHSERRQAFGRAGAITRVSASTTTVSPTLHTQSKVTRRLTGSTLFTVQVVTTVSPMRTGNLKLVVAPMKIVPGPGICMPSTLEI